jgi:hypothetical protein
VVGLPQNGKATWQKLIELPYRKALWQSPEWRRLTVIVEAPQKLLVFNQLFAVISSILSAVKLKPDERCHLLNHR